MEIKALESTLGLKLLNRDRKKRSLTLTPAGKIIYEQALKIQQEVLELENRAKTLRNNITDEIDKLNIIANTSLATYVLPLVLPFFQEDNPNTRVEVTMVTTNQQAFDLLYQGFCDLAFVSYDQSLPAKVNYMFQERMVLIKRADKKNDSQYISNLETIPLILPPKTSSTRQLLDEFFENYNISPNVLIEITHAESIKRAVAPANAYAILTYSSVREDIQKNNLVIVSSIPPLPSLNYVAASRSNLSISLAAQNFLNVFSKKWIELAVK